MPRTRKTYPPSLKAKVAVEAIKEHKTTIQIGQTFGVHPTDLPLSFEATLGTQVAEPLRVAGR